MQTLRPGGTGPVLDNPEHEPPSFRGDNNNQHHKYNFGITVYIGVDHGGRRAIWTTFLSPASLKTEGRFQRLTKFDI